MNTFGNVNMVRSARATTSKNVFRLVRKGELRWVFDFASPESTRRELRFWTPEITAPGKYARLAVEKAIDLILPPHRTSFNCNDIRRMFCLGEASAWRLAKKLGTRNSIGQWHVQRAVLARFLRSRWRGGGHQ